MRIFAIAFIALIFSPLAALAQRFDDNSGSRASRLVAQPEWLQFRIVSGRLIGISGTLAANIHHSRVTPNERITLEIVGGTPTVKYEYHSPREDLFLDLVAGRQFTARRTGKAAGVATFEFEQPLQGDLTLAVGSDPDRRVARAPNIWRLAVEEEDLCRQTLFPLLETLRPGWKLGSLAAAIEDALVRLAADGHANDRQQWKAWVDELGSDKFSQRRAAQRRLFEVGPSIAAFLEELDPASLGAEQRERVRALIAQFDRGAEDSIEQAAVWLATDPEIWLTLMSRPDESRRRLAARQLSQCLAGPIEFDPAADPAVRSEQIARLRTRLQTEHKAIAEKANPEKPGREKSPLKKSPAE